jgi:hypothetical protein
MPTSISSHRTLTREINLLQTEVDGPDRAALKAAQHRAALAADALAVAKRRARGREDDPRMIEAAEEFDAARDAVTVAEGRIEGKIGRISSLSKTRFELTGLGRADVRRAVEQVSEALGAVARIQAAIDALPGATEPAPMDPDALADAQLTGDPGAAKAFAEHAGATAAAKLEGERIEATRAALTERMEAAQQAARDAEYDAAAALHAALRTELAAGAHAFAKAAHDLFKQHGKLLDRAYAIRELDQRLGSGTHRGLGLDHLKPLTIPSLRIEGTPSLPEDNAAWRAERSRAGRELVADALAPPALEVAA